LNSSFPDGPDSDVVADASPEIRGMDQAVTTSPPVPAGLSDPTPADPSREWNLIWVCLRWLLRLFCASWLRVSFSGVENLDLKKGGLLLINHQSYLDPLVAGVWLPRPVSYFARDSLFRVPLLGALLRRTFVIPISREAARGGSIRAGLGRLDEGFLVGMFPEGTRSEDGVVGTFRPGFLAIARRTNQPLYPVGVAGSAARLPRGALWIKPGRVHVVFGKPLSLLESKDDRASCELIRGRVAECVAKAQASLAEKDAS
jgi:1-acyl-sn-glycerol-3-phosphate acyltransferase